MATLAEVNQTLLEVAQNTESTSQSIGDFIKNMKGSRGDQLEESRERSSLLRKVGGIGAAAAGTVSSAASNIRMPDLGFGRLGGLGGILTGAGLYAFGRSLLKGLVKKGLLVGLATAFADDIGNWVQSRTGSAALGDAAERATIGGAFGAIFGKKIGLLGAAIGAVATEGNIDKINELGSALSEKFKGLGESLRLFGEKLGFNFTLEGLQEGVGKGLVGLTALTKGDFDTFKDNFLETATLVGTLGLLIAPGPFLKAIKGITFLIRKSPLLRGLLALGAGVTAGSALFNQYFGGEDGQDTTQYGPRMSLVNAGITGLSAAYLGTKTYGLGKRFLGGSFRPPLPTPTSNLPPGITQKMVNVADKMDLTFNKAGQLVNKFNNTFVSNQTVAEFAKRAGIAAGSSLFKMLLGPVGFLAGALQTKEAGRGSDFTPEEMNAMIAAADAGKLSTPQVSPSIDQDGFETMTAAQMFPGRFGPANPSIVNSGNDNSTNISQPQSIMSDLSNGDNTNVGLNTNR